MTLEFEFGLSEVKFEVEVEVGGLEMIVGDPPRSDMVRFLTRSRGSSSSSLSKINPLRLASIPPDTPMEEKLVPETESVVDKYDEEEEEEEPESFLVLVGGLSGNTGASPAPRFTMSWGDETKSSLKKAGKKGVFMAGVGISLPFGSVMLVDSRGERGLQSWAGVERTLDLC